jgi:hypothetical protein
VKYHKILGSLTASTSRPGMTNLECLLRAARRWTFRRRFGILPPCENSNKAQ